MPLKQAYPRLIRFIRSRAMLAKDTSFIAHNIYRKEAAASGIDLMTLGSAVECLASAPSDLMMGYLISLYML